MQREGDRPYRQPVALDDIVTHDGLFSVDHQQRIVHWSDSAERILGLRAADILGRRCHEVIGGRDSRNNRVCRKDCPVLTNARRGRASPSYDILCTTPAGERKWLNVSVAVSKRKQARFQVMHLFRDVTEQRRTEEFARKAGSALRELLNEDDQEARSNFVGNPPPVPSLSRRELEVLRLLATGLTTGQIAESLAVKRITARNHITRLLSKLGVESRLQAVVYASQYGLL